jgi:hypothetical protein
VGASRWREGSNAGRLPPPGAPLIPATLIAALLATGPTAPVVTAAGATAPDYLLVPGAARVVHHAITALGGEEVILRHRAMVQEGEVTSILAGDEPGRLTRIFERPGRLRVTIVYPGSQGQEQRVVDGPRAWRDGEDVSGTPSHAAMALQAARLDLPYLLLRAGSGLVDGGEIQRDGRRLQVITVPLSSDAAVVAEIDVETGLPVRSQARFESGRGPLEFVTEYSDHRTVDGQKVPFREVSYAQGRRTGSTVLRRVEFLKEAPTGAFEP